MGATQYPKKYWWVILVVVPVVGGLIAVLPGVIANKGNGGAEKSQGGVTQIGNGNVSGSGNVSITGSDLSQKMFFINIESIAKEMKESGNQTLTDDLRKQIERAIELSQAGKLEESIRNWKELSTKVQSPSIQYNLAVANARAGNIDAARSDFKKALEQKPDFQAARSGLALLEAPQMKPSEATASTEEVEPNDELFQANAVALNISVRGLVASASDKDFYKFTTPPVYRDMIRIVLENQSSTLRPEIILFDARKSQFGGNSYDTTPGANLEKSFVAMPQTTFYVRIAAFGDNQGAYTLRIEPQKAYDAFEPNDEILKATPSELGRKIDASILDAEDKDFYKLKASDGKKSVTASLQNRSTTLRPQIIAFNSRKSQIQSTYEVTPGADGQLIFETTPGEDFYVEVNAFGDNSGAYSLVVQ